MDDTPASLSAYDSDSDLNGLKILDGIKSYSLWNVILGNALNNTRSINKLPSSDTSINSCGSIEAYSMVEDKDPPEIGDTILEVTMPNKKWLTPISIMVVDTISAVKSCTLLKVLFDPGSTATLINRKCLPKHCKAISIKQECKINTLVGSCETKSIVVMRNLRLPELDKNCVVDQQKVLVFNRHCKHDVILGADFLSKSGIDIRYSTGTIEWFDSKLPMRDPHQLSDKEYLAMADIIEVQREAEDIFSMDWYDPTCYASEYWTPNMAKYQLMNLQTNSIT